MKKLFVIMVLVIAASIVNAQRTPVKVADLPKGISEYVTKDFAGYTIKDAVKVVANNEVSYETIVTKGTSQETLLFDKDGKFVRKVTAKVGNVEKPATAKPAAKPAVKK